MTYSIQRYAGTVGVSGPPTTGPALGVVFNDTWNTAVNAAGDVYVADYSGDVVDEISTSSELSIIAGKSQQDGLPTAGLATNTTLKNPTQIALDGSGDVYFTDFRACEIDEINTADHLSIVAGDGSCAAHTSAGPATNAIGNVYGIAINPAGTIYFSDQNGNDVWKITSGALVRVAGTGSPGAPIPGTATNSPLNGPQSIAIDTGGNLYVADGANSDIEKITPAGMLSVIAGTGTPGNPVPGPATSSPIGYPAGIATDSAGDVFVADSSDYVVEEITPDGQLSVIAGQAGTTANSVFGGEALSSPLNYPVGLSVASDGVIYLGDDGTPTVDALVPDPPAVITAPTVGGTPAVGQTLSVTTGTWSNEPLSYGYRWQDCNSSGASCVNISGATSSSYTLTASDAGHTILAIVTASNAGGSNSTPSAATATVQAAPTPTPPLTPVSVTLGAVPSAGIAVTEGGQVVLTLICPATPTGCDASGVLVIHLPKELLGSAARVPAPRASTGADTVLASFSGEQIAGGHSALISVNLNPGVLRRLQSLQIRRVKVTLTISNHLSGGPATVTRDAIYLLIPPLGRAECPVATGHLAAATLGRFTLGITRSQARRLMRDYAVRNNHTDNFCLFRANGIRVGYGSRRLLGAAANATANGKVVLALSANPHYTIDGIRPGDSLAAAARKAHLSPVVHAGLNNWYIIPGTTSNGVLKVRHGTVEGVGIANKSLTSTHAQQLYLLRNF
jgi:hypothetical protein